MRPVHADDEPVPAARTRLGRARSQVAGARFDRVPLRKPRSKQDRTTGRPSFVVAGWGEFGSGGLTSIVIGGCGGADVADGDGAADGDDDAAPTAAAARPGPDGAAADCGSTRIATTARAAKASATVRTRRIRRGASGELTASMRQRCRSAPESTQIRRLGRDSLTAGSGSCPRQPARWPRDVRRRRRQQERPDAPDLRRVLRSGRAGSSPGSGGRSPRGSPRPPLRGGHRGTRSGRSRSGPARGR